MWRALVIGLAFFAVSCDDLPAEPTPPASLVSLTATPSTVVGGNPVQLTATLSTEAPTVGARIALTSSDPAAQAPPDLVIAEGLISGSVSVPTTQVSGDRSVTLNGSYSGITQSVVLRVTP